MALSQKVEAAKRSSGTRPPRDVRAFEAAFGELQHILEQLENGAAAGQAGLDVEQAVDLYERGTHLARLCEQIIDTAELRVSRLTAETATPLSDAPGGD